MDRCEECGFIYDDVPVAEVHSRLRAGPGRYRRALAQVGEEVARHRPKPDVWSALEYACHVRDVLLVQRDRTVQALVETNPGFARMHRDERVSLARYDAHPPAEVADQLDMAAELCATVFEGLTADQWARPADLQLPGPEPQGSGLAGSQHCARGGAPSGRPPDGHRSGDGDQPGSRAVNVGRRQLPVTWGAPAGPGRSGRPERGDPDSSTDSECGEPR